MKKLLSSLALVGLAWLNLMLYNFAEPLYYFLLLIPSLVGASVLGQVWLPSQSQTNSYISSKEN